MIFIFLFVFAIEWVWSSRKAWILITIFAIHSPFLLPSFLGGWEKGKRMTKLVIKSHDFLLDLAIKLVSFFRSTQESKVWVSNPNMDSIKCFKSWLFSYFPIRVLIPFHFVGAGCGKERNQCPHRNWKSYWLTSRKIVSFSVNESIKDIKNQLTKID